MALLTEVNWSARDPLILLLFLSCSWVFGHWIYNIFFHPLSNVPGPLLGRMSHWPNAYYAVKGTRHWYFLRNFEKYGNRIRITPNEVLFRSPIAYQAIYSSKANVKRSEFYDAMVRNEKERSTIATTNPAAHAKRRKMLNQAFTEKSLRASAAFMAKHIDRWNELLVADVGKDGWTPAKDFAEEVDLLVFDILGDICFGKSSEIKEPGHNPLRAIPHATVKSVQFGYPITKMPFSGMLKALRPYGLNNLLLSMQSPEVKFYEKWVDSTVKERLDAFKSGTKREDMFHFICKAEDPETGLPAFSDIDAIAEARLLTVAGSDTSSVTMTGALFYLAHYPERLAKLREEIASIFETPEEIVPGPKLASCKYLRACVDETLRICPAGLTEMPREVLPGGIMIEGEYYPEGTIVGTGSWPDSHNKEVYGDPEIFRPERWIVSEDNPPEEISRIKANFHPFGIGPYNCAGMNFAMQELMLMVAKTVHQVDFRVVPDGKPRDGPPVLLLTDAYIAVKRSLPMQFRPRAA